LAFLKFAVRASIKAIGIKADVVFATSTPLTIAIPAVVASKWNKVPMVFEVRDLWPEMPVAVGALRNPGLIFLAKSLEKFAYKNSIAVNALSPGMRDGIVEAGYARANISVIPNAADISLFYVNNQQGLKFRRERTWLDDDTPLMLYAGTFGLVNDLDSLVEIAAALKDIGSDIKVLAIGGGIRFGHVKNYAAEMGVLNVNFFMESRLAKKDMPAAYNAATICTSMFLDLPEMRKNSSNKFFDALAAGKPIFINHGGWMRDLVDDHSCGIIGWRISPSAIALELEKKLHDEAWLDAASTSSSSLARQYFDRDALAAQLLRVIEGAAKGRLNVAESIAPGKY
jgi:glycosyltransferase involved in cell wall biosynthesis